MTRYSLELRIILLSIVTLISAVVVSAVVWRQQDNFNSVKWKNEKGNLSSYNSRYRMEYSLQQWHLKIGMSKSDVDELLGTPDGIYPSSLEYILGQAPYGVDIDTMVIEFNRNSQIQRIYIRSG